MPRKMEVVVRVCLFCLVFCIPFYYADSVQFLALAGLLLCAGLQYQSRIALKNLPAFFWLWGGFVLWSWLSVLWSREPDLTRETALMNGLLPWMLFYVTYQFSSQIQALESTVLLASRAAIVVVSGMVLGNALGWFDVALFRPGWLSIEPAATTALALLAAQEMANLLTGKPKQVIVSASIFIFAMMGCWFISNRMVWIAFVGILVFGTLSAVWVNRLSRVQPRGQFKAINLAAIMALLILSLVGFSVAEKKHGLYFEARTAAYFGESIAQSERKDIWQFYWGKVQYQPWIGLGAGRELAGHVYGDQKPAGIFRDHVAHPHNWGLNVWLQLGVIGLLVLVAAHLSLIVTVWRSAMLDANIIKGAAVVVATLAAWTLKNMVDDQSFSPLVWLPCLIWGAWLPSLKKI